MTGDEFRAVVETVLDEPRTVPGRLDTIMRAAEMYAAAAAASSLRAAAEFFGMEPVNLEQLVKMP